MMVTYSHILQIIDYTSHESLEELSLQACQLWSSLVIMRSKSVQNAVAKLP